MERLYQPFDLDIYDHQGLLFLTIQNLIPSNKFIKHEQNDSNTNKITLLFYKNKVILTGEVPIPHGPSNKSYIEY